jgi:phosphopantothenoylcysteine decarboxylase / phosphopantothenate---cysteine ligase
MAAGDPATEPLIGLGVSGGIGAYKAVEVARLLQKRGYRVQAILTRNARRFVTPLTFEAITRRAVITTQFAAGMNTGIEHIALATEMRALLVAPATANIIGKFANGIADDFLSALYLATRAPLLIAPAMNTVMWEHPAVRANLAALVGRGVQVVEPGAGYLACGWVGQGRLAEPDQIAEATDRLVRGDRPIGPLAGRRVLVTAGPTIEDIDPVRFLGNRSSGRMGFAIAQEAMMRGASVTLIAGPTPVEPSPVSELIRVRSAAQMHAAVMAASQGADVVIMAAAVADYTPAAGAADQKVAKSGPVTLSLARTRDILADLGTQRGDAQLPVLVGFAAETERAVERAAEKLQRKRVDLIVANDVTIEGAGFDVDTNQVTLVTNTGRNGPISKDSLPMMSKRDVASAILNRVEALLTADRPARV